MPFPTAFKPPREMIIEKKLFQASKCSMAASGWSASNFATNSERVYLVPSDSTMDAFGDLNSVALRV
jgi:hypothetical protein